MEQERKYCVGCAHFRPKGATCTHPEHPLDFVHGTPRSAISARTNGFCKPYALGYEPVGDVDLMTEPTYPAWRRLFGWGAV